MESHAASPPCAAVHPLERQRLVQEALAEGMRHHQAGELGAAAQLYGGVLALEPEHAQALHLCGVLAHQQGAYDLARSLVERSLHAAPAFAAAHNTLGAIFQATGDDAGAEACFARALALAPDYPDALQNLGILHQTRGELSAAIDCYRRALALGQRTAGLLTTLGLALAQDDRHGEALALLDETLQLAPAHIPALLGRAAALRCLERYDAACEAFERALALDPACTDAWIGLGTTTLDRGDAAGAIGCFDRALAQDPDHPQLRFNRAAACLTAGRLQAGWRDYAWRWRNPEFDTVPRRFPLPRWDAGTPLAGRGLLLWSEQGLGDVLLFASMLDEVAAQTRHCVLECDARLTALLGRSFPGVELVAAADPPDMRTASPLLDCQAPLGDLPAAFRPGLASFPQRRAYLQADPERVRHWREALAARGPRPKIGICWRSSNRRGVRALACTELSQWHALLAAAPVDWINLQYDRCDEELERSQAATGITIHRFCALDMHADLDETAALMSALDLVISAPTTVSIMAAALGVPTWQLASGADWHTLGRPDSPWQPSLRRFYRPWEEQWPAVLARVAAELGLWLGARNAGG